jgi:ribonuclease VapC
LIVVDTSALMAILNREPEAEAVIAILSANSVKIAAPTRFEFEMVAIGRKHEAGRAQAAQLLIDFRISVHEWTDEHAQLATEAFARFGKGRHPAGLNFGDCMTYALARSLDAPLLFKGNDFAQTDMRSAL